METNSLEISWKIPKCTRQLSLTSNYSSSTWPDRISRSFVLFCFVSIIKLNCLSLYLRPSYTGWVRGKQKRNVKCLNQDSPQQFATETQGNELMKKGFDSTLQRKEKCGLVWLHVSSLFILYYIILFPQIWRRRWISSLRGTVKIWLHDDMICLLQYFLQSQAVALPEISNKTKRKCVLRSHTVDIDF